MKILVTDCMRRKITRITYTDIKFRNVNEIIINRDTKKNIKKIYFSKIYFDT